MNAIRPKYFSAAGQFPPTLVLNADYRPLSYFPLSLWGWQDVVKAVFLNRVDIVQKYERIISSPSFQIELPSVIALREYVQLSRSPAFTRFNVFLRDKFSCQYCSKPFLASELTFDHVIPRSKGGKTNWENVVAACTKCNLHKSNKMPAKTGINPIRLPVRPSTYQLQENGRKFPPNHLHHTWTDYLYWDVELELDETIIR